MDFVVLSSSKGTTFQAVLDSLANESLTARCRGLISDREDRGCVAKARTFGLPVKIVERKNDEDRETYDKRLQKAIFLLDPVHILACMGWMHIFSPWFVQKWQDRILNVHPSLLPKYSGLHTHQRVLQKKEVVSGMTIHNIDEGLDTGKILVQKKCPVFPEDTPKTLKTRVQELEKEWYPKLLQELHCSHGNRKIHCSVHKK